MNEKIQGAATAALEKVKIIRVRTWTLTLALCAAVILYFLIDVVFNNSIDWISFVFLSVLQITSYAIYFPDGELSGTKSSSYINNKTAYNNKATDINTKHEVGKVREYCKYNYEERRQNYIEIECGHIGIDIEEFNALKELTEKEIKSLKMWSYKPTKDEEKIIHFSKAQRKKLYKLIFCPIPVKANEAEFIMSGVESSKSGKIVDISKRYNAQQFILKIFFAVILGAFMAYLGFKMKDGPTLADFVQMFMYLLAIFINAVLSFTAGEKSTKVYKSNFYLQLANYLDCFDEWKVNGCPQWKTCSVKIKSIELEKKGK